MREPSDGDRFRKKATAIHRCVCVGFIAFVAIAGGLGRHFGGGWGLTIAGVVALAIACVGWFAATLIWAMSQDGG